MKSCKMPPSPLVAVPILATAILLSAAVAAGQNAPNDFIAPHNSARAAVNVGPMTWNATVAAYAEQYANYRSGSCDLVHSSGPYGENLFSGTGRDWSAADAVRAWVDEGKDYDYASNSCAAGKVCGHYTQVVLGRVDRPRLCGRAVRQRRRRVGECLSSAATIRRATISGRGHINYDDVMICFMQPSI
ncbi:hypothetical protein HPP92_018078 [Vanilla planifolia]|uniref:SCP domain-containing protein n=1 Tax=Vanilla planifolia TaxID=51239 RepID=A0A835QDN6_VANPL|nr:hypothetical protein HPP92_018078 [Vanilla planifolia]